MERGGVLGNTAALIVVSKLSEVYRVRVQLNAASVIGSGIDRLVIGIGAKRRGEGNAEIVFDASGISIVVAIVADNVVAAIAATCCQGHRQAARQQEF